VALLGIHEAAATKYAERSAMQLGATEAEGEDVSKVLRIAMRNGVSLIPRDSLPNAKWRIALGNASQVANENRPVESRNRPDRRGCDSSPGRGLGRQNRALTARASWPRATCRTERER